MYFFIQTSALILFSTAFSAANLEFLVSNGTEIWRIDGDLRQRLVISQSFISDLDYHSERNLLFWIDASRREINSRPLNSSHPRLVLKPRGDWNPVALALDSANDKVYVADEKSRKIDLMELDGRYRGIVLGVELFRPVDLKLDPWDRFLFVLDGHRLLRASMDGSSVLVIVSGVRNTLQGISVDRSSKRVYWVDGAVVKGLDYSGSLATNVTTSVRYSKFAVLNDSVYYAMDFVDFKSGCCDPQKGQRRKTIYESNPAPSIKIFQPFVQKSVLGNPCKKENGGCQHLCILMNHTESNIEYRCTCNVGWKLDQSLVNCTRVEEFIIFEQSRVVRSYDLGNCANGFCEVFVPVNIERSEEFLSFDYYRENGYMYYILKSNLKYDTIYKVRMNDSEPKVVLVGKNEEYQSLAIDWMAANMYFIDPLKETINVVNLKNESQRVVLMKNLSMPRDIAVHPNRGLIYFLQTDNDTLFFSRANSDGSNLTIFNHTKFLVTKYRGYAIDYAEDRIYWYCKFDDHVQHSNLELEDVRSIKTSLTKNLISMSVYKKWIYVVGLLNESLWRFDKKTGEQQELIVADSGNRINNVKIFSSEVQEINKDHPCNVNSGDCSELCFGLFKSENSAWTKVCARDSEKSDQNKIEDSLAQTQCL